MANYFLGIHNVNSKLFAVCLLRGKRCFFGSCSDNQTGQEELSRRDYRGRDWRGGIRKGECERIINTFADFVQTGFFCFFAYNTAYD